LPHPPKMTLSGTRTGRICCDAQGSRRSHWCAKVQFSAPGNTLLPTIELETCHG
jgi:hypothetical protein